MVITLMVVCRVFFCMERIITVRHLENMSKILLVTGIIVGYAYAIEVFIALYSGNQYESFAFANRAFGPYSWAYWIMVTCNVLVPQILWFKRARTNMAVLFVTSIVVDVFMWFERFVIVATSLHRDFLPASWDYYSLTFWDIATFIGSFGLFFTMFCLFVRFLPMVAAAEVKTVMPSPRAAAALDRELELSAEGVSS